MCTHIAAARQRLYRRRAQPRWRGAQCVTGAHVRQPDGRQGRDRQPGVPSEYSTRISHVSAYLPAICKQQLEQYRGAASCAMLFVALSCWQRGMQWAKVAPAARPPTPPYNPGTLRPRTLTAHANTAAPPSKIAAVQAPAPRRAAPPPPCAAKPPQVPAAAPLSASKPQSEASTEAIRPLSPPSEGARRRSATRYTLPPGVDMPSAGTSPQAMRSPPASPSTLFAVKGCNSAPLEAAHAAPGAADASRDLATELASAAAEQRATHVSDVATGNVSAQQLAARPAVPDSIRDSAVQSLAMQGPDECFGGPVLSATPPASPQAAPPSPSTAPPSNVACAAQTEMADPAVAKSIEELRQSAAAAAAALHIQQLPVSSVAPPLAASLSSKSSTERNTGAHESASLRTTASAQPEQQAPVRHRFLRLATRHLLGWKSPPATVSQSRPPAAASVVPKPAPPWSVRLALPSKGPSAATPLDRDTAELHGQGDGSGVLLPPAMHSIPASKDVGVAATSKTVVYIPVDCNTAPGMLQHASDVRDGAAGDESRVCPVADAPANTRPAFRGSQLPSNHEVHHASQQQPLQPSPASLWSTPVAGKGPAPRLRSEDAHGSARILAGPEIVIDTGLDDNGRTLHMRVPQAAVAAAPWDEAAVYIVTGLDDDGNTASLDSACGEAETPVSWSHTDRKGDSNLRIEGDQCTQTPPATPDPKVQLPLCL